MQIHMDQRAYQLIFEHVADRSGKPLRAVIPRPMLHGKSGDLYAAMSTLTKKAEELDDALATAKRLPDLSEQGRRSRVAEQTAAVRRTADAAVVGANHALKVIAEKRQALYEPPPPADAIAATQEASIQSRYATMSRDERKKLHAQMHDGQADIALRALVRDPLAMGPDAEIVRRSIWEPKVQRERADELAQLDDAEEEATAAKAGAGTILNVLQQFEAKA